MKIIPFNINKKSWHNYNNYLKLADCNINSLIDYLDYFNPAFIILNESLNTINTATWKKPKLEDEVDYSNILEVVYPSTPIKVTQTDGDEMLCYLCFPGHLKFRQGVYITKENTFITVSETPFNEKYDEETWNALINDKIILPTIEGQVVWSMRNPYGLQNWQHPDLKTPSAFLTIAQPYAGLYQVTSAPNGIEFLYTQNGQKVLGTNLLFTIELLPTRYFSTKSQSMRWSGTSWSIQGANWASTTSKAIKIVQNYTNNIWTGSYPLMHNIYLVKNNTYEDFIMDEEFETQNINIASHSTVMYNIKGYITEDDFSNNLWLYTYISII